MKTQLLTPKDTSRAARILRSGGLVGIPTETVYGLGANGLDPLAVRSIFQAKGRPQDNPLILHIPDPSWLELYCRDIPEAAWRLARRFWPGPLTMVLRRDPAVPDEVTAGLNTVGMRCPAHELCRAVIEAAGVPIAAPSGNTSGKPSPTSVADMLEDMNGKIDAILDGGSCQVGVESTIIDMTAATPRLLRPGGVPLEELRAVLGEVELDPAILRPMEEGEKPLAPGMKYRHYAPKAPVIVVKGSPARSAAYILEHLSPTYWDGVICFDEFADWYPSHPVERLGGALDHWENARRLFHALRAMDEAGVKRIWAQSPDTAGMGLAVVNRLDKAAGFHIVEV
ncbi:MAG: threonylcarbamoyl-AMP synthase [Lawsonibacter sp.]|jgi:L-threonylcarbamoyladenylate synthase|nr:threonylcarbamoyl-AMP synthase [Lawsonibacter sp.]